MRRSLLVTPLLLAACASGQGAPSRATGQPALPPAVIVSGDQVEIRTVHDNPTHAMTVGADAETVWPLLLRVYHDLGIPLQSVDRGQHMVESESFVVRRSIVNGSMTDAFDCGSSIDGPVAMTHRITADAITQLIPADSGHTNVATRISATAASNEGTSVNALPCTSRGLIEKRIAVLIAAHLASLPDMQH